MTQRIFAVLALLFLFSFFNAYAEETAPVPAPTPSMSGTGNVAPAPAPVPASPPNVSENKPASVSAPMPDVSEMVKLLPRTSRYSCPNGDVISIEGYVKKGNEEMADYDVVHYFLGDETVPYAATVIVDGEAKTIVHLDFNRDGFSDFVASADDPRLGDICTGARKTKIEYKLLHPPDQD